MSIAITGTSEDIGNAFFEHVTPTSHTNILIRKNTHLRRQQSAICERFSFNNEYSYEGELLKRFVKAQAVVHAAETDSHATVHADLNHHLAINSFFTAVLLSNCVR